MEMVGGFGTLFSWHLESDPDKQGAFSLLRTRGNGYRDGIYGNRF
jgi:hypothetical protein